MISLPGKDSVTGGEIDGDGEVEVLPSRGVASVSMGTISLVRRGHLKGLAVIDAETYLTGPAPVVADA